MSRGFAAVWIEQRLEARLGATLLAVGLLSLGGTADGLARSGEGGGVSPAAVYERALKSFQDGDYERTLSLLDETGGQPVPGKTGADIANLRGAANLRLHRYERAETSFATAARIDPHLWEARFNAAEVSFRQKEYTESARQFQALLDDAGRFGHGEERELIRYKALLSALLAGRAEPAATYVREHADDARPPAACYYLQAALDTRQGRPARASVALMDARSVYPPAATRWYAASFHEIGWEAPRTDTAVAGSAPIQHRFAPSGLGTDAHRPTTVAAVQLFSRTSPPPPGAPRKAPRSAAPAKVPPASGTVDESSMPPVLDVAEALDLAPEAAAPGTPRILAKPNSNKGKGKAAATPTPAPATPTASPSAASPAPSTAPAPDAEAATPGGDLPSANATPAPSPNPAFIQAYEAAYVQFLQEKYDEARELLDKADSIQPGQETSAKLRAQMFKHFYSEAYLQYASKNYDAAVKGLDAADKILPNQADSYNMRGLIFSREKNYQEAEAMFKKAIALDGTFWEAKFNQAELPFIRSNYTEARTRFENLLGQTDQAKQPKETELTEFKVFLTLLLEGKEPAARSLMERFNFTGATPARYYCQAALDFYHGDQEKALGWISSARKEYPAKLEGIFAQAFYRVGWFSEASAAAVAKATPVADATAAGMGAPVASSTPSVTPAFAMGTPAVTPSPAAATPAFQIAMASPAKSPDLSNPPPAANTPTPAPKSTAASTPTLAPTATPRATASAASATPVPKPTASGTPITFPTPFVVAVPTASAAPAASAIPAASAAPSVSATPAPAASAKPPVAETPTPEATPAPAAAEAEEGMTGGQVVLLILGGLALLQTILMVALAALVVSKKKARLAKKPLRYSGQTNAKTAEAEITR